jgi:hypothetical protein
MVALYLKRCSRLLSIAEGVDRSKKHICVCWKLYLFSINFSNKYFNCLLISAEISKIFKNRLAFSDNLGGNKSMINNRVDPCFGNVYNCILITIQITPLCKVRTDFFSLSRYHIKNNHHLLMMTIYHHSHVVMETDYTKKIDALFNPA